MSGLDLEPGGEQSGQATAALAGVRSASYAVAALGSFWAAGIVLVEGDVAAAAVSESGRGVRLCALVILLGAGWLVGAARIAWDQRAGRIEQQILAPRLVPLGVVPLLLLVLTLPALLGGGAATWVASLPGGHGFSGVAGIALCCAAATLVGMAIAGTVNTRPDLDSLIEAWERMKTHTGDPGRWRP